MKLSNKLRKKLNLTKDDILNLIQLIDEDILLGTELALSLRFTYNDIIEIQYRNSRKGASLVYDILKILYGIFEKHKFWNIDSTFQYLVINWNAHTLKVFKDLELLFKLVGENIYYELKPMGRITDLVIVNGKHKVDIEKTIRKLLYIKE